MSMSSDTTRNVVDGAELYFPGEELTNSDPRIEMATLFLNIIYPKRVEELDKEVDREVESSLPLTWDNLVMKLLQVDRADVVEALQEQPSVSLRSLGLGCFQAMKYNPNFPNNIDPNFKNRKLMPRIYNFRPITAMRHLKANLIGKLVSIQGTVVRVSTIKPFLTQMDFQCAKCEAMTTQFFADGKYRLPTKCSQPNCRSKIFVPQYHTAETVDWQQIRIQESTDRKDPGRIPRTVECELTEDMVDSCVPGDVVIVTGEVKVTSSDADKSHGKYEKNKSLFLIYLWANSVENQKQVDPDKVNVELTARDLNSIEALSQEEDLFRLLVHSICPSIYGHELVKVLTLFAGTPNPPDTKRPIGTRGNPHLLIVGDPGLGKSQMLTAVHKIAPRGVYVCGSYSSSTGLTVSLYKESGSGDYSLEAGALVLGDQGVCCIDEFDKMSSEHEALMEAMEQQSISIAKAGIVCTLLARTSIIAAANPVGGHYNRAKTVSENLKLNAALLSRFDLVFILLDKPDENRDHLISEHVMALHGNSTAHSSSQRTVSLSPSSSLVERLQVPLSKEKQEEPVHPALLRKYIGWAKKQCHPKLSADACSQIQKFYLTLREKHKSADSTPITTRQLESLIRLAQARAKIEMREEVTEKDALDVLEIMKESLFQRFEDEVGQFDFRRSSGVSKSTELKRFINALHNESTKTMKPLFSKMDLAQVAKDAGVTCSGLKFVDLLDTANTHGFLLKKGSMYKLICDVISAVTVVVVVQYKDVAALTSRFTKKCKMEEGTEQV